MVKLIGPFSQILPLSGLPFKGAIRDEQLAVIRDGGVLIEDGSIKAVGAFEELKKTHPQASVEEITGKQVLLPGFIDCHTHLCFAGNRAKDYALRIAGSSYLDIAKAGGGIWDTVTQTRAADEASLLEDLLDRAERHLQEGVTTIEIKSGYGLSVEQELKQLRVILAAKAFTKTDLVPTCLAAHLLPKDFASNAPAYLEHLLKDLLPLIQRERLANRIDLFLEEGAFNVANALYYLTESRRQGFDVTIHADQFTCGGSEVAIKVGALSADHLEASTEKEIRSLANSNTVAVVLPGASLGLGMPYAPGRKLLDAGACLAIASDWNPGSAPMGDLLVQAAVMGASEKLTTAETLAGLTFRAAKALNLSDRGTLETNKLADLQAYPCSDHRDILYYQGKLKPALVWKKGERIP
jgi:imidazolonepropionase